MNLKTKGSIMACVNTHKHLLTNLYVSLNISDISQCYALRHFVLMQVTNASENRGGIIHVKLLY